MDGRGIRPHTTIVRIPGRVSTWIRGGATGKLVYALAVAAVSAIVPYRCGEDFACGGAAPGSRSVNGSGVIQWGGELVGAGVLANADDVASYGESEGTCVEVGQ